MPEVWLSEDVVCLPVDAGEYECDDPDDYLSEADE